MATDTWKNDYFAAKLLFYMVLIVAPIILIMVPLMLYFIGKWNNIFLIFFLLIPAEFLSAKFIIKPLMEDAKYRLRRVYEHLSIEWVSSCIQATLQENKLHFTTTNNYVRKKLPFASYDVFFEVIGNGFDLGVSKDLNNSKATQVMLRYSATTNEMLLERIRNDIERRATAPLMK